jgi:hypothetical protein
MLEDDFGVDVSDMDEDLLEAMRPARRANAAPKG